MKERKEKNLPNALKKTEGFVRIYVYRLYSYSYVYRARWESLVNGKFHCLLLDWCGPFDARTPIHTLGYSIQSVKNSQK